MTSTSGVRRRLYTVLYVLASMNVLGVVGMNAQSDATSEKAIIAYVFVQDRILQPGQIAAEKLTRINYAFANIKQGRIVSGFKNDDQNLATLVSLKQRNPSLTVFVSVGGWDWSGSLTDMALTRASRRIFITSALAYVERHQLDGIDIDWEYPGQAGSTNQFRSEDTQNFTLLLKELRERFTAAQRRLHRPLSLSIAAGASSGYIALTEMAKVQFYLDTVNLMAYDYYLPGEPTGHHAPLFTNPDDPKQISADRFVREFEEAGVPPAKLVLGVPFYGHQWSAVADIHHGLFQPGERVPPGYLTYATLSASLIGKGFDRYWDKASCVPYLYNSEKRSSFPTKIRNRWPSRLATFSNISLRASCSGTMPQTLRERCWIPFIPLSPRHRS